jgi:hypothetical protein
MPASTITPAAVLEAVQNGRTNIWALGDLFGVAAVSEELHLALDKLMADGLVVASDPNPYVATLKASA